MTESLGGGFCNPTGHWLVRVKFQPAKDKALVSGIEARCFRFLLHAKEFQPQTTVWILWINQPATVDISGYGIVTRFRDNKRNAETAHHPLNRAGPVLILVFDLNQFAD